MIGIKTGETRWESLLFAYLIGKFAVYSMAEPPVMIQDAMAATVKEPV